MISPRVVSLTSSAVFCCVLFLQQLTAVSSFAADNSRRIPANNIIQFAPIDASVFIQLKSSNDPANKSMAGARLLAIDASGEIREFFADDEGVVLIDHVVEGVYALLASSENAHGAMLISMQENEDVTAQVAQDLFEKDFLPTPKRRLFSMTMMTISADQIVPIIENNLPETVEASFDLVEEVSTSEVLGFDAPNFDIKLGQGGALRGNLLSIIRSTSVFSAVSGTNVVVFKNGKPIGVTRANALGQFQLNGLMSGIHGVMVAGRGGYAAFSINVSNDDDDKNASNEESNSGHTYASVQFKGDVVQVALVPPPMLPQVAQEILSYYPAPVTEHSPEENGAEENGPEDDSPEARDSELPQRIEIAAKPKSDSTPKSKSTTVANRRPNTATLVLDLMANPELSGRAAPSPDQIRNPLRPIPINPLRRKRPTRVAPPNPLRP